MEAERNLIDLERAGWQALATDGDAAAAFYEERLASRCVMLLPGGMLLDDRDDIVDSMRGAPWDEFALSDERVIGLGDGSGVVVYRVDATRGGDEYAALVSSTYVSEGGRSRLAVHQQTPV